MDERWTTVTLAADAAKPHEEALRWVTSRVGTGIERIRVIGVDPAIEGRTGPDGKRVADALADAARTAMPDVRVEVRRHAGPFAAALVEESDGGDLLVVGTFRGRRGSTAGGDPARVAERAAVPTVVVPEGPHPIDGDVVLAVEEPIDERALAIAVDEAHRLHRRVTLLRAWEMPVLTRTGLTDFAEDPLRWRTRNAELLQRVTTALTARYPGVRFHPLLVEGHPGRAIAAHTRRASLVVLGLGHVTALSGSVLHDVLRETASPVCVVPRAAHGAHDVGGAEVPAATGQPARSRAADATRFVR
ncbi:ribosomal protein L12E/L44/L45/RPP1/RPP2 [Curtobacterium sp. 320]|uniref:universal stress protein n=1 Tax=Curtobacterium sp. 320 TaxID=2817749 RepID=UPI002856603A|nr:universal stress protein [Curtobacterium sp. 320]MDR6574691.1 ribosomal protein L12E/L44/L45/RPP1/RPP2 [Curtobacterium sp. 320]